MQHKYSKLSIVQIYSILWVWRGFFPLSSHILFVTLYFSVGESLSLNQKKIAILTQHSWNETMLLIKKKKSTLLGHNLAACKKSLHFNLKPCLMNWSILVGGSLRIAKSIPTCKPVHMFLSKLSEVQEVGVFIVKPPDHGSKPLCRQLNQHEVDDFAENQSSLITSLSTHIHQTSKRKKERKETKRNRQR